MAEYREGKYNTEIGAKRAARFYPNSCIVRFQDGSYDWFPQGHSIGDFETNGSGTFIKSNNYRIVSRCCLKSNGDYEWQAR